MKKINENVERKRNRIIKTRKWMNDKLNKENVFEIFF